MTGLRRSRTEAAETCDLEEKYRCPSHRYRGKCSNGLRIRQDRLEAQFIAGVSERGFQAGGDLICAETVPGEIAEATQRTSGSDVESRKCGDEPPKPSARIERSGEKHRRSPRRDGPFVYSAATTRLNRVRDRTDRLMAQIER
jgi:hypothetical protein